MSAKSRKIWKWCILGIMIFYAAGICVWAHNQAENHICTGIEIEISGPNPTDQAVAKGITEELKHYPRKIVGTPLHQINTADIERFLTRQNNFESVNCMITSRGKLVVSVLPLIPVMRVFYGDNSYYINKDGKHIQSNAEFFSDVPIVTGNFNRNFAPDKIIPLINFIKKDKMLSDLVSMVEAKDAHNLILIPRIKGHVINFGDTSRLAEKTHALQLFYKQVMPYKGWEEYDTISVKYRGQVVATRRNKARLNVPEQYIEEEDLEEGTLQDVDETKLPTGTPQEAPKPETKPEKDPASKPTNEQPKPQG